MTSDTPAAPVRVLVVHPRDLAEPSGGGIQTFLRDFVAHSPADFEIAVAGVTADERARPVGEWSDVQIGARRARFLPLGRQGPTRGRPPALRGALRGVRALRRELRRPGTILQLHRPYRHALFRGHHGPRVQIIHLDLTAWPGPSGWRRMSWIYREFASGLDRIDRVFIANEAGAAALARANPSASERIEFLPGWYDDQLFRPLPGPARGDARRRIAGRLGLPEFLPDDRLVLFVGRLDPIKDPELAVDAFAELMSDAPAPARLIVCGDGELRRAVEARAAARGVAGRTHLVGDMPREGVAELMAAADVLLVTSIAEGGGPRVVLEALGSGLPVVSTIVGEVKRAVTSGRTGWLVEDRDPRTLAAALGWALSQPRDEVAAAAVEAAAPFVASAVLSRLYAVYRALASTTRLRPSRLAR